MNVRRIAAVTAVFAILSTGAALAQPHDESDILICGVAGMSDQISIGAVNTVTGTTDVPSRVFAVALGPLDGVPGFYGDEGFFAVSNPASLPPGYEPLAAGLDIQFEFKAFSMGNEMANLWYWDPSANPEVDFHPATDGLTVTHQKSPINFWGAGQTDRPRMCRGLSSIARDRADFCIDT